MFYAHEKQVSICLYISISRKKQRACFKIKKAVTSLLEILSSCDLYSFIEILCVYIIEKIITYLVVYFSTHSQSIWILKDRYTVQNMAEVHWNFSCRRSRPGWNFCWWASNECLNFCKDFRIRWTIWHSFPFPNCARIFQIFGPDETHKCWQRPIRGICRRGTHINFFSYIIK